jgi:hypothetical protein
VPTEQRRRPQNLAYAGGLLTGLVALLVLAVPAREAWHARGPMNVGHEALRCAWCHRDARGSFRQQVQANFRYALGLRQSPADLGRRDVGNQACLSCHDRPDDRHPVYRFLEPRFAEAREKLAPQQCTSCHREHTGKRVTLGEIGYCENCHEDTHLRKDPIDVPHERLIALDRWQSCLGCHDFHGNHLMQTATTLDRAIAPAQVRAYFDGGASPYGSVRRHEPHKNLPELDDD